MVLVDALGLPVSVETASASRAERHLVQQLFDFMLPNETLERSVGDKAYDSRLCMRGEESTQLYRAFLHLGCTLLLLKRVLG